MKLKNKKSKKGKGFISSNRTTLMAVAGAVTGFAVIYLLNNGTARQYVAKLGNTLKGLASKSMAKLQVA
jgi:hypothetical protein